MKFVIALAVSLASALACADASSAVPDPASEEAIIPPLRYQSPFLGYRPQGEVLPLAWKDANDEVGRIGGWRAYAKEATVVSPGAGPASPVESATVAPPSAKPPAEPPARHLSGHDGRSPHQ